MDQEKTIDILNDIELVLLSGNYPEAFYKQSLLQQVITLMKVNAAQKKVLEKK